MKRTARITLFIAFSICTSYVASACSCVADPIDVRFRKANAVFVAQAVDPNESEPEAKLIQGDGQQTLRVIKSWKGVSKRFVSVNFEPPGQAGMCPLLYILEPGKRYLVFAYGRELTVRSVCSDTEVIPGDPNAPMYDTMRKHVKNLNSFWFRLRARLRLA